jgi:hypothetical protein
VIPPAHSRTWPKSAKSLAAFGWLWPLESRAIKNRRLSVAFSTASASRAYLHHNRVVMHDLQRRPIDPALTEFLAANPGLATAIEAAKAKIQNKARAEVAILIANLGIILRDFCEERGITQIPWASSADPVKPEFALDHLADRLTQKLSEIWFSRFLERFADGLLEVHEHESRSQ